LIEFGGHFHPPYICFDIKKKSPLYSGSQKQLIFNPTIFREWNAGFDLAIYLMPGVDFRQNVLKEEERNHEN